MARWNQCPKPFRIRPHLFLECTVPLIILCKKMLIIRYMYICSLNSSWKAELQNRKPYSTKQIRFAYMCTVILGLSG